MVGRAREGRDRWNKLEGGQTVSEGREGGGGRGSVGEKV